MLPRIELAYAGGVSPGTATNLINGKTDMLREIWLWLFALITIGLLVPPASLQAAPRIKVIKLAVTNPTNQARAQENIVLKVAEIKRVAPDFKAGTIIITTSDAATLDEDARTLETIELPSQADDLDGDGKYDELAFQIPLGANQTRIVTIAYGDAATLQRLRGDYPQRTYAKFATKYEGMGWESELAAW